MRTHRSVFLLRAMAFMWITSLPSILDGSSVVHAAATPPVGIKPTATITGEVKIVLLNHHGEIDGFLLADGTRVKFPPHIGASLAAIAKPGQRVSVIGFTGLRTQFGTAVEGLSVTSAVTGQTVIDQPPTGYETRPSVAGQWLSVTGNVARILVNPAGSVDGLIMASGEQVKLPPHVGYLVANALRERDTITVSGPGARTNLGTALRASEINLASGEILTDIDGKPDKKGKKAKKG
jgi:hypothetical protein